MVSQKSIEEQLKRIDFKTHGWGRREVNELQHIILEGEEIYECVNGIYEGGFALLVASDVRVLLVDKKPLNYLTVEDMRFDMITEIDYSHRLLGANITVSSGDKHLKFRSYNQPRLRKLIGHIQHCMAENKKKQSSHQEGQNQHLERINQQLQSYLMAQYQQQQKLHEQLQSVQSGQAPGGALPPPLDPLRPSPELADYLFAQSLLAQHQLQTEGVTPPVLSGPQVVTATVPLPPTPPAPAVPANDQLSELYAEGMQEIFGKRDQRLAATEHIIPTEVPAELPPKAGLFHPTEINPMRIAYSKLPMALRNRKLSRPSFHAPSVSTPQPKSEPLA